MQALRFDFRDLFRAPRWAFSLQRMWIILIGLGLGLISYIILTYMAFLLGGLSFAEIWLDHGLLPCLFAASGPMPWFSWMIYGVAALILLAAWLLTHTAVARAAYMSAKGNHFYSWREAYSFALRKAGSVLATPFSLLLFIGIMLFLGFLLGVIGRVPLVGPLGVSLLSFLWFVCALFLIYLIFVCLASFFLTPAIIATTDEDAFEAVFQVFSITWNQPWRWIVYQALNMVLSLLSFGVLAVLGKHAVVLTNSLLSAVMGTDFVAFSNNGQALVQNSTLAAEEILQSLFLGFNGQFFFTNEFIYHSDSLVISLSSFLYAAGLIFLGGWIVAYGLSTLAMGQTLSYMVLRHKKDGENLLERKDREEEVEEAEAGNDSSGTGPDRPEGKS